VSFDYYWSLIWGEDILVVNEERFGESGSIEFLSLFCLFVLIYVFSACDLVAVIGLTLEDFASYLSLVMVKVFFKSFISELLGLRNLLLFRLLFWFYILTTSNSTITSNPLSLHEHCPILQICIPFCLNWLIQDPMIFFYFSSVTIVTIIDSCDKIIKILSQDHQNILDRF